MFFGDSEANQMYGAGMNEYSSAELDMTSWDYDLDEARAVRTKVYETCR